MDLLVCMVLAHTILHSFSVIQPTFEEKFIVHSLIFTVLYSLCALNKESHNFEKQAQQYLTNLCTKFQLHGFIRAEVGLKF